MGGKKKPEAPSTKVVKKEQNKLVEDKTFGIKNKKGAKAQKFVSQVTHQIKGGKNQS